MKAAIRAARISVEVYRKYAGADDAGLRETLRAGVIQTFETAYESCWKFMKRWLEMNVRPDIVLGVSRREFYRIAAENALIDEAAPWWEFHEARNQTSHVYDGGVALDVFERALAFLPHAERFAAALEARR